MTDKQVIKKFSDNHCLVLENNQISLRENEFTAYQIVLGKSTNELLEFVKDTYLQLTRKEQECERLKGELSTYGATGICETCTEKAVLQNDKYAKALREIKEITKKAKKDICNNCDWINTDSCDPEDYTCGEFIKILQKISEVKNDR